MMWDYRDDHKPAGPEERDDLMLDGVGGRAAWKMQVSGVRLTNFDQFWPVSAFANSTRWIMAEAIGLVASVIQVASTGLQLSKTLYLYADGVATSDRRIKDIAREIQLTSLVIQELGDVFGNDETEKLVSSNAVNTARQTMEECSNIFVEIEATLKKSNKNVLGRLLLPFRDAKIELLRNHIDKLKKLRQRQEIQQLLERRDDSTKRYEQSLRNFNTSTESTLADDDVIVSPSLESTTLGDNRVAAAAMSSSITITTLGSCIQHVRSLLKDIETLQETLINGTMGDDHSLHHETVLGSYLRARTTLDHVLCGSKETHEQARDQLNAPHHSLPAPGPFLASTASTNPGIAGALPVDVAERKRRSSRLTQRRCRRQLSNRLKGQDCCVATGSRLSKLNPLNSASPASVVDLLRSGTANLPSNTMTAQGSASHSSVSFYDVEHDSNQAASLVLRSGEIDANDLELELDLALDLGLDHDTGVMDARYGNNATTREVYPVHREVQAVEIDFGDLGAENSDPEAEYEEDDYERIGLPADLATTTGIDVSPRAALPEDELYMEMMEGLAGATSSDESEYSDSESSTRINKEIAAVGSKIRSSEVPGVGQVEFDDGSDGVNNVNNGLSDIKDQSDGYLEVDTTSKDSEMEEAATGRAPSDTAAGNVLGRDSRVDKILREWTTLFN
ncbi:hypothetical protein OPT61_g4695 [Boeremia exigua]|uniref:Uncharacterized protein n=1 Tax=Boeremia exigua TaxID=749465 RepID=A0ACC2ID75_9PLEO|nr:hypothetical protein OPT61_g4695 [Boeremia exigua]